MMVEVESVLKHVAGNSTMNIEAISISYQLKGYQNSTVVSGVLFNDNFAIASGSLFIPLLHDSEHRNWVTLFLKSLSSKLDTNKHISKVLFRIFKEGKGNDETSKVNNGILPHLESEVVGVWKCPLVTHSLDKLFYDWTLGNVNDDSKARSIVNADTSKELMSIFIFLRCRGREKKEPNNDNDRSDDNVRNLFNLMLNLREPNRGQEVEIVSTPFGNKLFFNSLSQGIISNIVGSENCIILTDARTVSGCEGAPIFEIKRSRIKEQKRKLIGLVTCPLTWWRGEWVGLTIGINLFPILRRLFYSEANYKNFTPTNISQTKTGLSLLQTVDENVVLVQNKTSWGSGVVLNAAKGIIITCSHVVTNEEDILILYKNQYYPAALVYKCPENVAYDLAIIKIIETSPFKNEIKFYHGNAEVGDVVIAAGYPFFSERDEFNLRPSLVCGCVARVNPFMIQTTCCIQSGFSGGPLLKEEKLLGLIVSNAKDGDTGALFPHINFIIPATVFQDSILEYINTNNVKCLIDLETFDPKVQSQWALQTSKL